MPSAYLMYWYSDQARQISKILRETKCPIARSALIDTASMEFTTSKILERLELLQEAVKEAIQKIENLEVNHA